MNKIIKKCLLLLIVLIVSIIVSYIAMYVVKQWFYYGEIIEGYNLKQRPLENTYDLISNDSTYIYGINGWIVSIRFIYGYYGYDDYFLIDRTNGSIKRFASIGLLNKFLKSSNLPIYSLNDEESYVDLKYDDQVNRKYRFNTIEYYYNISKP